MPSTLSITPPWPGKRLPVSFILAFLFKKEKNKSPVWQKNDVIMLANIVIKLTFIVNKRNKLLKVIQLNINDPIDPENVLLGLILEILGPLNILPNKYPPISEAIHVNKRENKTILN